MGGIASVMGMMPGMNKLKLKEGDIDEKRIERLKAMILSMTKKSATIRRSSTLRAKNASRRAPVRACRRSINF